MLIPNMTMADAYRPSNIEFSENQFPIVKNVFLQNDFLMRLGCRVY